MDLSTVVDLLSVFAIVIGLLFAGVELRQLRKSRERESALELFNTFQSPEFMRGVRTIFRLPDDLSREQVEDHAAERMEDVYFAASGLEGLGTLVYKEEISLELVEDFFSGLILVSWRKLGRYAKEERVALDRVTMFEWFQWLAEMIAERETTKPAVPGYIEYRDWKPK